MRDNHKYQTYGLKLSAPRTHWVIVKMLPETGPGSQERGGELKNVQFSKQILDGDAFQTTLGETLKLKFCGRHHWLSPKLLFPLLIDLLAYMQN